MFVALNQTDRKRRRRREFHIAFPINAVKTPNTLNSSNFKIIHFKKKYYKAHSKKFRLMFDN